MTPFFRYFILQLLTTLIAGYGDCDDPFHIKKQTWSTSDSKRDIENAYKIFPHIYDQNVLQFIEGNCAYSLKLELPNTCFQIHAPTTYGRDSGLLSIEIFEKLMTQKWHSSNNYDTFFDFNMAFWVDSLDEYITQWMSSNDLKNEYFGIEWRYNIDPNMDLKIESPQFINNQFYSLLIHSPFSAIIYEFLSFKKPSNALYNIVPKWQQSSIARATFKAMNNPFPWNRADSAIIVPVRISRAATNIYTMYDWYTNVLESLVLDYSIEGVRDDLNGDNVLTKYAVFAPLDTQIEIAVFERPLDYTFGDFSLLKYENLLWETHNSIITTPFCGIDRWLDNHFGYTTWTVPGYLDRIMYKIRQRGMKYRIYKETKEHTTNRAKAHLAELGLEQLYIFFIFSPNGQTVQLMGDFTNANAYFSQIVPVWNQQWCEVPCPYGSYQGSVNREHIYVDYVNDGYDSRNQLYYYNQNKELSQQRKRYSSTSTSLKIAVIVMIFGVCACVVYILCKSSINERTNDLIPLIQK